MLDTIKRFTITIHDAEYHANRLSELSGVVKRVNVNGVPQSGTYTLSTIVKWYHRGLTKRNRHITLTDNFDNCIIGTKCGAMCLCSILYGDNDEDVKRWCRTMIGEYCKFTANDYLAAMASKVSYGTNMTRSDAALMVATKMYQSGITYSDIGTEGTSKHNYQLCRIDHDLLYTEDNCYFDTQYANIIERLTRPGVRRWGHDGYQ